jgi:hypothetical protein
VNKTIVGVSLVACGCAADPILQAWHHPYEVTSMSRGTGSCDPVMEPTEPDEPFVFFAVGLGDPDVATLYWCEEQKNCPVGPWVSIAPVDITLEHAEGTLAEDFTLSDTTCQLFWDGLVADLAGDTLTATVTRWFPEEIFTVDNPSECEEIVADAVGVECDEVTTFEAVRADD